MSATALFFRAMTLIPSLLCLGVHEWAHAMVPFRLGDPTAEEQGRLTLNPLAHVDLVGILLLPLLGVLELRWVVAVRLGDGGGGSLAPH